MDINSILMCKRVLIVGDSLTFGSPKYDIWFKDSWPGLIEKNGISIFHRGKGGADSRLILNEIRHLNGYLTDGIADNPPFDACIIQVGIVDCTPRLLPKIIWSLIRLLPIGRQLVDTLSKKSWLLQIIGNPWVGLKYFEKNISNILDVAKQLAHNVIFIEIAKPAHFLIENCGDFSGVVDQYNNILKKIPEGIFLPVFDGVDLGMQLLPDGHHLTKIGHQNVAKKLSELFNT